MGGVRYYGVKSLISYQFLGSVCARILYTQQKAYRISSGNFVISYLLTTAAIYYDGDMDWIVKY